MLTPSTRRRNSTTLTPRDGARFLVALADEVLALGPDIENMSNADVSKWVADVASRLAHDHAAVTPKRVRGGIKILRFGTLVGRDGIADVRDELIEVWAL